MRTPLAALRLRPSPAFWSLPIAIASATLSCGGDGSSGGTGGVMAPPPTCPDPIQPVGVSAPNAVVGGGAPGDCTEAALDAALAKGGVVTFNCGPSPITITVTQAKAIKQDTVIDGGGKVTLSGGGKTRILHLASAWDQKTPKLTGRR
jgi:hypothetical protein